MSADVYESPYSLLDTNESRVVVLHPGQEGDPICCHLERFSLDAPPQYEALSYVSGSDSGGLPDIEGDLEDLPELEERHVTRVQASPKAAGEKTGPPAGGSSAYRTANHSRSTRRGSWDYFPRDSSSDLILPPAWNEPETGASPIRGTIVLGNHEFPVGENLESALGHLRRKDCDRKLWIDAISIDRRDEEERGHQVLRMSRIYQSATVVCVWLGPPEQHSDEAMEFIRRLWQINQSVNGTNDSADCQWEAFKGEFMVYGYPLSKELSQLRALSFLMDRKLFYRRWVIQEVAFGAEIVVQCGHSAVQWPEFTFAISFLHSHHDKLTRILHTYSMWDPWLSQPDKHGRHGDIQARAAARFLFVTRGALCKNESNRITSYLVDVETLLMSLLDLRVSDPRDTVYALLPLAGDAEGSADLIPDYRKPTVDVFIDVIRHVLRSKKSLDILCRPWAPPGIPGLPSWIMSRQVVPGSDTPPQDFPEAGMSFVGERPDSCYRAGNCTQACAEIFTFPGVTPTLRVKGCIFSLIATIEEVAHGGRIPTSWKSILEEVPLFGEFWRVLVGDRAPDGDPPPPNYESICRILFNHWPTAIDALGFIRVFQGAPLTEPSIPKSLFAKITQFEEALGFFQRLCACTWNRRLVATSNSSMGLVPPDARIGDLVCVLLGCSVPVILRRKGEKYIFIGEAYVRGIMDGEALGTVESRNDNLWDIVGVGLLFHV